MEATRSKRSKKVAQKLSVVTDDDKKRAIKARLEALENDDDVGDEKAAGSDDDFQLEESEDELALGDSRKKKRKKGAGPAKRKTRAAVTEQKGPKPFLVLLEEADLESVPSNQLNYQTAAVGPPAAPAFRKWCTVCGFAAPYKCTRCSSRFCSRKCYSVHSETRCLKFTA